MPFAIDLFAGGGGLSVGLKRAGFSISTAVEIEKHAFATYTANHPEVTTYKQDVRTINGRDLKALVPNGAIDLLAGCPPCQGFTSLTSKYKSYDLRNDLVREMARLVEETRPKAVMMENVPGLASRGSSLLNEFQDRIEQLGYAVNLEILQVAGFWCTAESPPTRPTCGPRLPDTHAPTHSFQRREEGASSLANRESDYWRLD